MKYVLSLLLGFTLIFLTSCSKSNPKVITSDILSEVTSDAIILTASCQNTSVVRADVKAAIDKWFSGQQLSKGDNQQVGIVAQLCITSIQQVVPALVNSVTRPEWGCTDALIKGFTTVVATLACSAIPV